MSYERGTPVNPHRGSPYSKFLYCITKKDSDSSPDSPYRATEKTGLVPKIPLQDLRGVTGMTDSAGLVPLQGYPAHKKLRPARNLQ